MHQQQIAKVQPDRQVNEKHVVLARLHVASEHAERRQGSVERVQHAFRIAGGARGERHAEHLVGRHGDAFGLRQRQRRCKLVGERHGAVRARAVDHADEAQVRQFLHHRAHHAGVVEALEALRAHVGAAAREAQDVAHLAAAEVRADRVGDRADEFQREEHESELDPVGQLDGDHVAAADAVGLEHRGGAVDAVFQFAIGDAAPGIDQRLAVGMHRDTRGEKPVDRVPAPPAARGVARDHFGGEPGLEGHAEL